MSARPPTTLSDILRSVGVSAVTGAIAIAVAWGATSTRVSANSAGIDKLWSSLREIRVGSIADLQRRQTDSEKVQARILQSLDDSARWQNRVDNKLDRLVERGR